MFRVCSNLLRNHLKVNCDNTVLYRAFGSGRSKKRSVVELMRWHKPTGTLLTLAPALWSVTMASPGPYPDPSIVAIFTAGAIAARGIGCTINDILDKDFDRQVERTKMRPIASGDISTKEAICYLTVQSFIGLYILCLNNVEVIKLGLLSGIFIASYPLFKRFTHWPQAMLGITFNFGVPMGYAAVTGSMGLGDLSMWLPIYAGSVFWTLYYDTVYAHQDKTDDAFVGVKSTALILGDKTKQFLSLAASGMASNLAVAGLMTNQCWPYYLAVASTGLFHFAQIKSLNLDNTQDCWTAFDRQKYVGLWLMFGILVSTNMKSRRSSKEPTENIVETPK